MCIRFLGLINPTGWSQTLTVISWGDGTDSAHTPAALCTIVIQNTSICGFLIAFDTPSSGTFAPTAQYEDRRMGSVMLAFYHDMFADEARATAHPGLDRCRAFTRNLANDRLNISGF